jgi:hypothetical protein
MSNRLRARLKPPWTLLFCCAAVAGLLGFEWVHVGVARVAAQGAAPPAVLPADGAHPARFVPPPADRFSEIAERPLFVPGRRPQPDEAAAAPTPAPPRPTLVVQGVVLTPERRYAVIRHGNPPKLDSISEGATVDGWKVTSIDTDRIVLSAAAATVEFEVAKSGHGDAPDLGRASVARRGQRNATTRE